MKKSYLLLCFSLFALTKLFSQSGIIFTYAGNGTPGYNGDGIAATNAELDTMQLVAVDDSANLYIADAQNNRVRKVYASTGIIATVAGNGTAGYGGDYFSATIAELYYPVGVAVDAAGNLYITDAGNVCVRKVTKATGIINTIAGRAGFVGDYGNGLPGDSATFNYPTGIAVDALGDVFIADGANNNVRELKASDGLMYQYAGNNTAGSSGDGGPATSAQLNQPLGISLDKSGNLYIADCSNYVIRKVDASGNISTFAGILNYALYNQASGPANVEAMRAPSGVWCDKHNNVYIADAGSNCVREVNLNTLYSYVVAGDTGQGFAGDGRPAIFAEMSYPFSVAVDTNDNLYINDLINLRIRKVTAYATAIPQIYNKDGFSIYPNPASNQLNIQFSEKSSGKNTIEVYDITGRIATTIEKTVSSNALMALDISSYQSGVYFIKITGTNNSEVFKFVKE